METVLIWIDGRTLIGEMENGSTVLKNAAEVKAFYAPTPQGLIEVAEVISLIPKTDRIIDVDLQRASLRIPLGTSDEIVDVYQNYRAQVSGISLEKNLNNIKTLTDKKLIQ